ncbi:NDR1/HIN1-like protein 1 [Aristolochia californica]|uniref:NDR1/HIN1-like protein 1 n=1 Tax=Aristolochia californica TaxID=171875 RepID=UPI0035E0E8AB
MAEEEHTGCNMTETSPPREHHKHITMTEHCHSRRRTPLISLTIFLLLAGVTVLIVWLIYRPHRPHFTVVGAAIYDLNTSSPVVVSTTMQFTILVHNPNDRVSIYYDRLTAFVSYKNQAITPPLSLPPLVQGHRSTVSMSPMLGGAVVPVAPHVANGLVTDEAYGVVGLRLVFLGRLRWKGGAIKTRRYGLYVRCDMILGLKKGFAGQAPLLGAPGCSVDV